MPKCNPRCPLVREQLKKIAVETPWLLKELTTNGDRKAAYLAGKFVTERLDVERGEERKSSIDAYDSDDRQYAHRYKDPERKTPNGKRIDATQTPTGTEGMSEDEEMKIHTVVGHPDKSVLERRIRTSATQWTDTGEGLDELTETDVHPTDTKSHHLEQDTVDRMDSKMDQANGTDEMDKISGMQEAREADLTVRTKGKMEKATRMDQELLKQEITDGTGLQTDDADREDRIDKTKKTDKETLKQEATHEAREFPMFRDECEPNCPRRVSRKNRIRKLEEAQCIVDAYLLNKGARYFDDVCTCSLSCVVRALRRDPFVTSTLASIALFTIGLKLCSELDAWYLPIRFS